MAVKKKAVAVRRKKATHATKTAPRRRRRKSPGLSEMMSKASAKRALNATMSGGLGGGLAALTERLLPNEWGSGARTAILVGESFALGAIAKAPNMAAGVAGAAGYLLAAEGLYGMSEGMTNYGYVQPNTMNQPMFLDENGAPVDYQLSQPVDYQLSAGHSYMPYHY